MWVNTILNHIDTRVILPRYEGIYTRMVLITSGPSVTQTLPALRQIKIRRDTKSATQVNSHRRSKLVPYGDFNGDCGIHTVLVVEIDALYIQTLQTRLARGAHILRVTSHFELAVFVEIGKFRRQLHLVPDTFDGLHAHSLVKMEQMECMNISGHRHLLLTSQQLNIQILPHFYYLRCRRHSLQEEACMFLCIKFVRTSTN